VSATVDWLRAIMRGDGDYVPDVIAPFAQAVSDDPGSAVVLAVACISLSAVLDDHAGCGDDCALRPEVALRTIADAVFQTTSLAHAVVEAGLYDLG
jgi:hypothetical protein